jgi:hypothetical protein
MTDEKKKGKALNALKKKFNTGGRVNARRGGTQELQEQLGVDPKRSTKTAKTSEPKNPTQEGKASDLLKPFQQFDPSANNKTGGGLDLGQQPTKSYRELGGTEAEFRPSWNNLRRFLKALEGLQIFSKLKTLARLLRLHLLVLVLILILM